MSRGRNWTPAERAIIYAGVCGGLSLARINQLLLDVAVQRQSPRSLPQSSYDWILNKYCPKFLATPSLLGECIEHPRTDADL